MGLLKHFKLFAISAKLEAMDRTEDPIAFMFIAFGTVLRIAFTIIFFQAIYGQVQAIGGWELDHVYVLLGTWFFIDGISWATYTRGFLRLYRLIERGELDLFLIKPVNLKVFLSYRYIDAIFSTPSIVAAIAIIIYGMQLTTDPINIFTYLLFLLFAFSIHHSFSLMLGTINFYYIIESPEYLRNSIMRLGQYPITIYTGIAKFALSFIVPLAFIFTVPVRAFFGEVTLVESGLMVMVVLVFYLISSFFWKRGINHYESAKG